LPAELAPLFPQLEILELLGQGGMGAVYKVRQPRLDRLVALKILPPEAGRDPPFAERFRREAQALARLSHPHIVAVHDFGQADGLYFLVMEYVDGVNLRQVLRKGRLQPEEALRIVPQLCDGLHYAHEEGVVHRDVKPENILLDKRGRVKIADFGLAKLLGRTGVGTLTGTHQVMGTPHYMAPEQMEKPQEVDHRADIYSLGVVFYELLTGQVPMGNFPRPSEKVQVDVRLDRVVLRAMAREPERRYQHAGQVRTDVDAIAQAAPPAVMPAPVPQEKHWDGAIEVFCDTDARTDMDAIGLAVPAVMPAPAPREKLWDGVIMLFSGVLNFLLIGLGMLSTQSALPLWAMPLAIAFMGSIFFHPEKYPAWTIKGANLTFPLCLFGLPFYGVWLTHSGEPLLALLSFLVLLLYAVPDKKKSQAVSQEDPEPAKEPAAADEG
jgi:predicted Ser/Thr protein kinase